MRRGLSALRSLGSFLWRFIVGDDLTLAAGVLLGIVGVVFAARSSAAAWGVLPVVWVAALFISLRKAVRRGGA